MAINSDQREQLAVDQAALLAALTVRGETPHGFDAARLQAAADSLTRKRARAAARAWPGLAESFGPSYRALFLEFAAQKTLPRDGGPLADARAFVRYRKSHGDVPDDVRRQALSVDLRFKTTGRGLVARRLPAWRMAWLRAGRRLVIGIWIPAIGERWFSLSLGRRRHSGTRRL